MTSSYDAKNLQRRSSKAKADRRARRRSERGFETSAAAHRFYRECCRETEARRAKGSR
jgi:hypothetical protein